MKNEPVLLLFRRDLRLADNAALCAAVDSGSPVLPVYIVGDAHAHVETGTAGRSTWPVGAAQKWWIHHSLTNLRDDLRKRDSDLILRVGATSSVLLDVARTSGARSVYLSTQYEPHRVDADRTMVAELEGSGLTCHMFGGSLLHNPDAIRTSDGRPYRVFTPFYRKFLEEVSVAAPRNAPAIVPGPATWPSSVPLDDLGLLPRVDWAQTFTETGVPGESHARERLANFAEHAAATYGASRDTLGADGTSKLSPRLALGELSPRQIWHEIATASNHLDATDAYLRQLVWREFSYHVLVSNPSSDVSPLRDEFETFDWVTDDEKFKAWTHGQTGYPVVDAGMRQLWQTGWMHNRARMIVASFLTKHLRIHWLNGARWFWDTLVDADLANNTMGWQWSAGSGADAQPYFRIFNPTLQGKKFDADGTYVRRWVPELQRLPAKYIHQPSSAPDDVLRNAGVELGRTYPRPVVDHRLAREKALAAYKALRKS